MVTALAFVLWYSAVAWRRVFAAMRLKPTQYRCAAEQLLRRLRLDGALPSIHPLVDLGNATSAARSLPIAVLDLDQVVGEIVVRPASGMESYVTFGGEVEHPLAG
ncbi:MAG: phenylalanine--tRNA ligase beta subunit-related protein [Tetrasphaera sp.]